MTRTGNELIIHIKLELSMPKAIIVFRTEITVNKQTLGKKKLIQIR